MLIQEKQGTRHNAYKYPVYTVVIGNPTNFQVRFIKLIRGSSFLKGRGRPRFLPPGKIGGV